MNHAHCSKHTIYVAMCRDCAAIDAPRLWRGDTVIDTRDNSRGVIASINYDSICVKFVHNSRTEYLQYDHAHATFLEKVQA